MKEALEIINSGPAGFMVAFSEVRGASLLGGYFPAVELGEPPIATENEAWSLAARFANNCKGRYVDIYVIRCEDFTPVPGYKERKLNICRA